MEAAAGVLVANQAQHILQFTQEIVRSIHLNHNLNRRDLIRTLLRQCRHEFPKYNVAIFEEQFAMIMSNDIIYNKSHELQDLISKFKFRLVIFGKGSISVLGDRHNGKRWGCAGKWNYIDSHMKVSVSRVFAFEKPTRREYPIYPPRPRSILDRIRKLF